MSIPPGQSFDIQTSGLIRADPAEVFEFLVDLENHWLIADRFVDVVDLTRPPGARSGGRVRLRAPLGVRRTAATRVELARPPVELRGSARIGSRTRATVRWSLQPSGAGTLVTLAARLEEAGPLDRLLWLLGARAWMRRRFEGTLRSLGDRFPAAHRPP